MEIAQAINNIIANGEINIKANEGDYIGDDGLLYCGKCNTKKQTEVEIFGSVRRPMCLCKCEVEAREAAEAEQRRQRFEGYVRLLRQSGFQKQEMQSWTFANDDMANERVTGAMLKYVENFDTFKESGKGLLLYGDVGTGKTYAACEVANALLDKGFPVLVTNFARIVNTLQGMFDDRQEYIDSFNKYALLVLDDLGAERKSEYMQEQVYNIIDSRYRAGLPMIITTNLQLEEITQPDNIGNRRIYDRIIERCFPVEVAGTSRRRKAVRKEYNSMKEMLGL